MKKNDIQNNSGNKRKNADITLEDVAKKVGLSHMSVSRALRGAPGVSKATIERIMDVVKEMGYDPAANHAARRMAMKRYDKKVLNQVIALFFPRELPTSYYYVRLYLGVLDEVEQNNFGLLTHYVNDISDDKLLPPLFMRGEIDGVIMLAPDRIVPFVHHLRNDTPIHDKPIVTLIEPLAGCSAILTDDFNGGYQAVNHLLDLGHRHILHSAYKEYTHQQRLRGFKQAFIDRNLDPDKYLHYCYWNNEGVIPPTQVFISFLRDNPEITGVVAPNDEIAIRMYQVLNKEKIAVPGRISLIGYDDALPFVDKHGENILTTIALPLEDLGREAVRQLIKMLLNNEEENREIILPVALVVRSTTAPPYNQ